MSIEVVIEGAPRREGKWGIFTLSDGSRHTGKSGYFDYLMQICEAQFGSRPEYPIRAKVYSWGSFQITSMFHQGVWVSIKKRGY